MPRDFKAFTTGQVWAKLELDPAVRNAFERAHALNRAGRLTPAKLCKIAHGDVDLLRAMGASSNQPGNSDEGAVLRSCLDEAIVMALEAGPPIGRSGSPQGRDERRILQWFLEASDGESLLLEFDGGAYVQWILDDDIVRLEVSGGPAVDGPAHLNEIQERAIRRRGWERPKADDFPNYWIDWDIQRDRHGRIDLDTAQGIVDVIVGTCEEVFSAQFRSDEARRTLSRGRRFDA